MIDPAVRTGAINTVLEHVDDLGHLDTRVLEATADRIGCVPNTIRCWIEDSGRWQPPKPDLDERLAGAALHASAGNIAQAYRLLQEWNAPGLGSESSFRRLVNSNLKVSHAYASDGKRGLENLTVYMRHESKRRNDLWQGDHTKLDIYVKPPRGTTPIRPWVTTFVDTKSRLVVGYAITAGNDPNSEVITATLARAVTVRPSYLDGREVDGGEIGGIPLEIRHDHGGDWKSERVEQVMVAFGITSNPTRTAYTGHQNGKAERFHRTINEGFCAPRQGYVTKDQKLNGKSLYNSDPDSLLTFAQFKAQLDAWFRDYNVRVHSSLNASPLEAWISDCHLPLRVPTPEALRTAMLRVPRKRKVQKYGIEHNTRRFFAAALPPVGTPVRIRHVAYEYDSIEVFDEKDNWLCTAYEVSTLSDDEQKRAHFKRRNLRREIQTHASLGQKVRGGNLTVDGFGLVADPDTDPDAPRKKAEDDDQDVPAKKRRTRSVSRDTHATSRGTTAPVDVADPEIQDAAMREL